MVFTGRPSAGCATCKRRKKKCDLTKPFCKQCKNLGKECPGVPEEIDTLLRNTLVQPLAKSGRDAQTNEQPPRPLCKQQCESAISSAIPTDWSSTAVTYYFHLYSLKDASTKQLNPWFELQSRFYVACASDTGLHHAITALAAMTMAIDLRIPEFIKKANLAYGRALRAVNNSLADSKESRRNDVAIGIFAMISFELKQQDADFHIRYETHIEGMKQLLLLRGREQLEDPESFRVFRSIRPLIIYDHILRRKDLTGGSEHESIWTYVCDGFVTPIDDLCIIAAKIPTLLAETKNISASSQGSQICWIIAKAVQLNGDLIKWRAVWQFYLSYEVSCCVSQNSDWWHGRMHRFTGFPSATLLCQYDFLQIQVLEALSKGLATSATTDSTTYVARNDVHRQIQDSVNEICYIVPFITSYERPRVYPSYGEAVWILLPIVVASLQRDICDEQRAWLNKQLASLNADFNLFNPVSLPYDILKLDQWLDTVQPSKASFNLGKKLRMA